MGASPPDSITCEKKRGVMPRPLSDPLKRFESQFIPEPNSGCWLWLGNYNKKTGYGSILIKFEDGAWRGVSAHRYSYESYIGGIPSGFAIDHKCRNRLCVNPEHLRIATQQENLLCGETAAAKNSKKDCCPRGHDYDHVKIYKNSKGQVMSRRGCYHCAMELQRKRRAEKKGEHCVCSFA